MLWYDRESQTGPYWARQVSLSLPQTATSSWQQCCHRSQVSQDGGSAAEPGRGREDSGIRHRRSSRGPATPSGWLASPACDLLWRLLACVLLLARGAFHTARPPGLGSPLLSVLASRRPPTDPPPKHPAPGRRQRTENDLNRKGGKIIPHDDVITSTCLTAYNPPSRSRSRVATRSDGVASRPQASCLRRGFLASQARRLSASRSCRPSRQCATGTARLGSAGRVVTPALVSAYK